MAFFILISIIAVVILIINANKKLTRQQVSEPDTNSQQLMHFDLLDENGNPVKKPKVKVVVGGGDSDAPVQELQYFCIKDKGYHVSVWPKNQGFGDCIEFNIAGITHRDNIDHYIGEFVGTLEPEPTNEYDHNAIKILAPDGNHVGYVPKDITSQICEKATLPCPCFCYIGNNDGTYFSDCYIPRK